MSDRPEGIVEGIDPNESPFPIPPIEGLPFDRDSEEARAIREVIAQADRERAAERGGA